MQATADSRVRSKYCGMIKIGNNIQEFLTIWLPNNVNKRCPAIIFAARRTDKVIGRMILLTSSIKTIKGINTGGVPEGTKWARNSVRLFVNLNIIKATQRGRAKERVIAIWLVAVKVKERSPIVLFIIIKLKMEIKMMILVFLDLRSIENSLFIEKIIFVTIVL